MRFFVHASEEIANENGWPILAKIIDYVIGVGQIELCLLLLAIPILLDGTNWIFLI